MPLIEVRPDGPGSRVTVRGRKGCGLVVTIGPETLAAIGAAPGSRVRVRVDAEASPRFVRLSPHMEGPFVIGKAGKSGVVTLPRLPGIEACLDTAGTAPAEWRTGEDETEGGGCLDVILPAALQHPPGHGAPPVAAVAVPDSEAEASGPSPELVAYKAAIVAVLRARGIDKVDAEMRVDDQADGYWDELRRGGVAAADAASEA